MADATDHNGRKAAHLPTVPRSLRLNDVTAGPGDALAAPGAGKPRRLNTQSGLAIDDAGDARLFAAMRFILVLAGLVIVYLDPTEPSAREGLTYGVLASYCIYAASVLLVALQGAWTPDQRLLCAVDVVFASALVLWTQGTSSMVFYVFLFPILVVSFSRGYRDGLIFTIASVATFLLLGSVADPPILSFELNLALIRPVYLLALGYMIAKWGGREILFKRRLMLLRDVNASNPRAKLDEIIEINLRRILEFHNAERCVLVLQRASPKPRYVIYTAARAEHGGSGPQEMTEESGERILCFKDKVSILYSSRAFQRAAARTSCVAVDCSGDRESAGEISECEFVAALLEACYFVAVPYRQSDGTRGRLFLTSDHDRFTRGDVQFLLQFTAAVSKVVENLQLLDQLVSSAAEHERVMISRDIHDAAVQPYIGLRLGLEALYRDGGSTSPVSQKILDLIEMANATVRDLRGYTRGLLEGAEIPGGSLGAAILMQNERHKRFFGLDVTSDVDVESSEMTGRVASQVFYIVVEALSNVVKHTASRRAFVEVRARTGWVSIRVGNEQSEGLHVAADFIPKSIKSRVEALGGLLEVQHGAQGYTVVRASIPT
jgi:signal transduction histidine kinase